MVILLPADRECGLILLQDRQHNHEDGHQNRKNLLESLKTAKMVSLSSPPGFAAEPPMRLAGGRT